MILTLQVLQGQTNQGYMTLITTILGMGDIGGFNYNVSYTIAWFSIFPTINKVPLYTSCVV
jgi:hypothetical protein